MKGFVAACVLLIAQAAVAYEVVNIDDIVDKYLKTFNQRMLELAPSPTILPPIDLGETQLSKGFVIGDDSYSRIGESYLVLKDHKEKASVDIHLNRDLFHIYYSSILYQGDKYSGVFRIPNSDFHVTFDVRDSGSDQCRVEGARIELKPPAEVLFFASIKKYDGIDVTDFFKNKVLPKINEYLAERAPAMEKIVEGFVCEANLMMDDMKLQALTEALIGYYYH